MLGAFPPFVPRVMSAVIHSGVEDRQDLSSIVLTTVFGETCAFPELAPPRVTTSDGAMVATPGFIRMHGSEVVVESDDVADAGFYSVEFTYKPFLNQTDYIKPLTFEFEV